MGRSLSEAQGRVLLSRAMRPDPLAGRAAGVEGSGPAAGESLALGGERRCAPPSRIWSARSFAWMTSSRTKADVQSHRTHTIDMVANVLGRRDRRAAGGGGAVLPLGHQSVRVPSGEAAGGQRRPVRGGRHDGAGRGQRRRGDPSHRDRAEHHGRRPGSDPRGPAALRRDRRPRPAQPAGRRAAGGRLRDAQPPPAVRGADPRDLRDDRPPAPPSQLARRRRAQRGSDRGGRDRASQDALRSRRAGGGSRCRCFNRCPPTTSSSFRARGRRPCGQMRRASSRCSTI